MSREECKGFLTPVYLFEYVRRKLVGVSTFVCEQIGAPSNEPLKRHKQRMRRVFLKVTLDPKSGVRSHDYSSTSSKIEREPVAVFIIIPKIEREPVAVFIIVPSAAK
jgi:hypothetical protein